MVIYNVFLCWFNNEEFYITTLIKNILFLKSVGLSHMWYMPMIIGVYIFLPFVADYLKTIDIRILKIPFGITFFYLFLVPVFNVVGQAYGIQPVGNLLDLSYSGGVYGIYLLCGYFIKKGILRSVSADCLAVTSLAFFIGTVILQMFAFDHQIAYSVWYSNGLLLVCAMVFFELFSRSILKGKMRLLNCLSRCSFGIYLVHNPVLMILKRYVFLGEGMPIRVLGLFVSTFVISWLIVAVIGSIPKVGNVIFYVR